jgi:hypothetical protein
VREFRTGRELFLYPMLWELKEQEAEVLFHKFMKTLRGENECVIIIIIIIVVAYLIVLTIE